MSRKIFILLLVLSILSQYTFGFYVFAAGPQIVTDGKTATELEVNGDITNIRTSTIREGNALNSFKKFNVNRNNIANLFVPDNASNLINLIHSETSHINGILNSIKNDQIGGNVFFLNPHGIMVGPQGAINVGSLTAVTPTAEFMDSIFISPGNPSLSALNSISEGNIPVSDSGLITVAGGVNAINDINLMAGDISVADSGVNPGSISTGAIFSADTEWGVNTDRVNFSNVVNINGVESGDHIAVENGNIKIEAAGDFINEGVIAADGADDLNAGSIDIKAGNNIQLNGHSLISARGDGENSDGGDITIFADQNSEFNQNAVIDVRGGNSGDGGFIELSAQERVLLRGGRFKASAQNGEAGSILIDPEEIEIVKSDKNRDMWNADYYFDGADYTLEAEKSITVNENVTISTRNISGTDHLTDYSTGDSGNLKLIAPIITLESGSRLLAHAVNREKKVDEDGNIIQSPTNYAGGDITLTAEMTDHPYLIEADADTGIYINGATIKGENISLDASSTADYSWSYADDLVTGSVTALGSLMTGVAVGIVQATADSEIIVKNGSVIEAEGKVDLTADNTASAEMISADPNFANVAGVGFVYGKLKSDARIEVQDGVSISASDLNLAATNDADLDISLYAISPADASVEAGIAVTSADVDSTVDIASGAEITAGNSVTASAINNNSFSTEATAMALGTGKAGIAATIFNADTDADVSFGSDLIDGNPVDLTIQALDNILKNKAASSAAAGSGIIPRTVLSLSSKDKKKGTSFIKQRLGLQKPLDSGSGATEKPKLAGAVTVVNTKEDSGHTARAVIKDGTEINTTGDVVIAAQVSDAGLQNHASSSVESKANGDVNNPSTTYSLSAAVAYGDYNHNADAHIGADSIITAEHLGIKSDIIIPYQITWHKWDGLSTITDKLNNNLGLANGFMTGYANATGSASKTGIAGSVSYLDFSNNSQAYIDRNVEVSLLPGASSDWSTTLPSSSILDADSQPHFVNNYETIWMGPNNSLLTVDSQSAAGSVIDWASPLHVAANTGITGAFAAGNLSLTLNGAGGQPGAKSAGGAYNQINYTDTTRAYVAEGALLKSKDNNSEDEEDPLPVDMSVTASSQEKLIAMGPTAGRGASFGLNGIFSLANIDSTTEASIDDEAQVTARDLLINAEDEVESWSITGAFNKSENVGIGLSTAINKITTDTDAFIGDNDDNDEEGSQLLLSNGKVKADNVAVKARTDGRIESISVAASMASSSDPDPLSDFIINNAKKKIPLIGKKLAKKTNLSSSPRTRPKFGLGISGSVAYNVTDLNTSAFTADSLLDFSGDNPGGLTLTSLNNTDITAASGAGALVRANNSSSKFSVGIAGSVAINSLNNNTSAYGDNVDIIKADNIASRALSGGEALAVAIGATLNVSADQDKAASVAGSVSVNMTGNKTKSETEDETEYEVESYFKDSNISGNSGEIAGDLALTAYDRSKLGTGSGTLLAGGKAGLGAAISYSGINNDVNSYLSGTTASSFDNVQIHGYNSYRIGSGGGMGTVAGSSSVTLSGSFVINDVDNITGAEIKSDSDITAKDKIDLLARDTDAKESLDSLLKAGPQDTDESDYDYEGSDEWTPESDPDTELEPGIDTDGSSILTVAGLLQGSGNNLGISLTWNDIASDFTASVSNSELETTAADGQINVKALAATDIKGFALGVGLASGFAGAGSVVINEGGNNIAAEVDTDQMIKSSDLNIEAVDNSQVNSLAGQVTLGLKAALGGDLVFNDIDGRTEARLSGGTMSEKLQLDGLLIKSSANQKIGGTAIQGSGGKYLAAGAAIVDNDVNYDLETSIAEGSNLKINNNGTLELLTNDEINIDGEAQGYEVAGGVAAGAVAVNSTRTGKTGAVIGGKGDTAEDTEITFNGGELIVDSQRQGKVKSLTRAGAGGAVLPLDSSHAVAKDIGTEDEDLGEETVDVQAALANNVIIDGNGAVVDITATGKPYVSARAEGYNGSLTVDIGLAKAKANADLNIDASIGSGGDVTGGSLEVKAFNQLQDDKDNTAYSYARAVNAAGLLGVNATNSIARSNIDVNSSIASDLDVFYNINLRADNKSSQKAEVFGVDAAGLAAVGANLATASSDSTTEALILDTVDNIKGGLLWIEAIGTDINNSYVKSGSGAIVEGSVAEATTDTLSEVKASLAAGVVANTWNLKMKAVHNTEYNSRANSINAAAVGFSGTSAENTVNSTVIAEVGDKADLNTTGINVEATNSVEQSGVDGNVRGGAGGVYNGSAVTSTSTVTETTELNIGEDVVLKARGNPMYNRGVLNLGVNNILDVFDETVLTTGGAIQNPSADTSHTANLTGIVDIAKGADLHSAGNLQVRAYTDVSVYSSSLVKTYGAVAEAGGNAINDIVTEQNIEVGEEVELTADGNLELAVGKSGDGWWKNNISGKARTEVYNYTGVPIGTSPDAESTVDSSNKLAIKDGTVLESGRDIILAAYEGEVEAEASGKGHNPYLDAFGTEKSEGDETETSSSEVTFRGTATAGIYHDQVLNIDSNGVITEASRGITYSKDTTNPQADLQEQIDYLKDKKDEAGTESGKDDIQAEIDILTMLKEAERNSEVDVINVNDIFAAGGNIIVKTDHLHGIGNLTAQGGPRITVDNYSDHYLNLDHLSIPADDTGGSIKFSGTHDSGFNLTELNKDRQPRILVNNYYDSGGSDYGPGIFLNKPVENLKGAVEIFNQSGNLAQFSELKAKEIQIEVPNGFYIVNNPYGFFHTSAEPSAVWSDQGFSNLTTHQILSLAVKKYFAGDYTGNLNQYLKDPYNRMGNDPQITGLTYVLTNFPNEYDEDGGSNNQVKLFNGFWMDELAGHLSLTRTAAYSDGDHTDGAGPDVAASQIGINARYININGEIRAGNPTNWSIKINQDLKDWIDNQSGSGIIDVPVEYMKEVNGEDILITNYEIMNGKDSLPDLRYDPGKGQLILDDINASGGGFVFLRGDIISTNEQGHIKVLNGLGDVRVTNNSSVPLEINGINTGRQKVGQIKIEDTAQDKITWYVNTLGNGTRVYEADVNYDGDYTGAEDITSQVDNTKYAPLEGQRYQWVRQISMERRFGDKEEGDEALFYRYKQPSDWQVYSNRIINYEVVDKDIDSYFHGEVTSGYLNNDPWSDNDTYNVYVNGLDSDEGWPEDTGWHFKVYRGAGLEITNSVKADNIIGVSFEGNEDANVDINSAADVILGGRIRNSLGDTSVMAEGQGQAITQASEAIINSVNINMTADSNLGSFRNPIRVNPDTENGGRLSGISNQGNVYFEVPSGSVKLAKLSAGNFTDGYRNINLTAAGNINTTAGYIWGSNITLNSESGAVGSKDKPLEMKAIATEHSNGDITGGEVSIGADGDIYIKQVDGDLHLLKAHSVRGDVGITVNNGNIINVVTERRVDLERKQELADIWDSLAITGEKAGEYTVKPYEEQVESVYREYWHLYERGEIEDGKFILNDEEINSYQERAITARDIDPANLTEAELQAEVRDYAAGKFSQYESYFDDVFGSGWKSDPGHEQFQHFQNYNSNYSYIAPADKVEELTEGAEWSQTQLLYQISLNALNDPGASGELVTQEPNIIGEKVYLNTAGDTSGSIGSLDAPIEIELPEGDEPIELSDSEKAALARSNMPGDVTILDAGGEVIKNPLEIKKGEAEAARIHIVQTNPVYLDSSDSLYSEAGSEVFINSENDIKLGRLMAGGDIRLITDGSIIDKSADSDIAIMGGANLALETAGSIGSSDKLLTYEVDGLLASVSAAEDIYLKRTNGDMRLVRMGAVGTVRLEVPSGGIYGQQKGLSLSAGELKLAIRDDIKGLGYTGGDLESLAIEIDPEGELSGEIGGEAILASPGKDLNLGEVNIDENFTVTNSANLAIDSIKVTAGDVDITAAGSITGQENTGENITAINIDLTAENGSIGEVDNYLNIDSSHPTAGVVNAVAGNDIYLRETSGEINIDQFSAGRNIGLAADTSILSSHADDRPDFKAEKLILVAEKGSIGKKNNRIKTQVDEITEAIAEKGIYLVELGGNLNSQLIKSKTSLVDLLAPDGDLQAVNTEAVASIKMAGSADMSADRLTAEDLILVFATEDKSAVINQADIEETVDIMADNLQIDKLNHTSTGTGPLLLTIRGGSREMADNVDIIANSEQGFNFEELTADFSHIEANADDVNFLKTKVGSRAELYNNYYSVIADNINKKLFDCDLQLHPRNKVFYLLFSADRKMLTDAMIAKYDPDFIANKFSTENNFVRQINKMIQVLNSYNNNPTVRLNRGGTLLTKGSIIKESSEIPVNIYE